MNKLAVVALGLGFTVITASPVFAERTPADVEQDMYTVVANRAGVDRDLDVIARGTTGLEDAVLGVQARPDAGVDLPAPVVADMVQVVRQQAERERLLSALPEGGSR